MSMSWQQFEEKLDQALGKPTFQGIRQDSGGIGMTIAVQSRNLDIVKSMLRRPSMFQEVNGRDDKGNSYYDGRFKEWMSKYENYGGCWKFVHTPNNWYYGHYGKNEYQGYLYKTYQDVWQQSPATTSECHKIAGMNNDIAILKYMEEILGKNFDINLAFQGYVLRGSNFSIAESEFYLSKGASFNEEMIYSIVSKDSSVKTLTFLASNPTCFSTRVIQTIVDKNFSFEILDLLLSKNIVFSNETVESILSSILITHEYKTFEERTKYFFSKNLLYFNTNSIFVAASNNNIKALKLILSHLHHNETSQSFILEALENLENSKTTKVLPVIKSMLERKSCHITFDLAVLRGEKDEIDEALKSNPYIDMNSAHNPDGMTALHNAVSQGHLEVMTYLLDHNVDSSIKNQKGLTACDVAINCNQIDCAKLLLRNVTDYRYLQSLLDNKELDQNMIYVIKSQMVEITLFDSVNRNNIENFKKFLNEGVIHDIPTGLSMIEVASIHNATECILLLLPYANDIKILDNISTNTSLSPALIEAIGTRILEIKLVSSIRNNDIPTVQEIISNKLFDVNFKDLFTGQTVLHHAASNTKTDIILMLLQKCHQNINSQDKNGFTPMHVAAMEDKTPAMFALFKNGAKLDICDSSGLNPLYLAAKYNKVSAFQWLLNKINNIAVLEAMLLPTEISQVIPDNLKELIHQKIEVLRIEFIPSSEDMRTATLMPYDPNEEQDSYLIGSVASVEKSGHAND